MDGWMDGWMGGWVDTTKLIIDLCNFSNEPKNFGGSKAKEFNKWP
jgi:hypothetical protein